MQHARTRRCRLRRAGITLIELMVVVGILLLLTAIAVPALQSGMGDRQVREAARALNVYISSARYKAMETGRPVGIVLERAPGQANACTTVRQAEVPLPYMGSYYGMIQLRILNYSSGQVAARFQTGDLLDNILRPGDTLQVNYGGIVYTVDGRGVASNGNLIADSNGLMDNQDNKQNGFVDFGGRDDGSGWNDSAYLLLTASLYGGQAVPWPDATGAWTDNSIPWSNPVPFQIIRKPMPTAAEPLVLPSSVVIDLDWSGARFPGSDFTGNAANDRTAFANYSFTPTGSDVTPIIILFSPNGGIHRVVRSGVMNRIIDPLYLLVGKRERVRVIVDSDPRAFDPGVSDTAEVFTAEDGLPNCFDFSNLWITVSPQTGLLTVNEMHSASSVNMTNAQAVAGAINTVRTYAREAQGMGGR